MKLWFKAKEYGWGWRPASWEGWLVICIYAALLVLLLWLVQSRVMTSTFLVMALALSTLLIVICYKTGERPHWRWG